MMRLTAVGAMGLLAFAVPASGVERAEDVKSAIEKLTEAGSYTWTATPKSDGERSRRFSGGPTEGKVDAEGVALLKMSMGDQAIEAVVKGESTVLKVEGAWKTAEELRGEGGQNRRNPASFMARRLRGLVLPADYAKQLAEAAGELSEADGALAGALTEEGARKILLGSRSGDRAPEVKEPGGSVKFWIEDGVLSKYEYTVKGKMTFREREFEINRTVVVELKDIGKTEFEIPEEAKAKLQS